MGTGTCRVVVIRGRIADFRRQPRCLGVKHTHPPSENRRAHARPIPFALPVIRATFPSSRRVIDQTSIRGRAIARLIGTVVLRTRCVPTRVLRSCRRTAPLRTDRRRVRHRDAPPPMGLCDPADLAMTMRRVRSSRLLPFVPHVESIWRNGRDSNRLQSQSRARGCPWVPFRSVDLAGTTARDDRSLLIGSSAPAR